MKTYKDFLLERKAFSPRGEAIREKKRAQNEENRKKREAAAAKGSAIVKHKSQVEKDEMEAREAAKSEAKQKLASGSAGAPKLTPKKPTPKAPDVSAERARQLDAIKRQQASDKFAQRRTGFGAGVKKALGGDVIGSRKTGDKHYDELAKRDREEKRKEFAQKKMGQLGNLAKSAVGVAKDQFGKANQHKVQVSKGSPIA